MKLALAWHANQSALHLYKCPLRLTFRYSSPFFSLALTHQRSPFDGLFKNSIKSTELGFFSCTRKIEKKNGKTRWGEEFNCTFLRFPRETGFLNGRHLNEVSSILEMK